MPNNLKKFSRRVVFPQSNQVGIHTGHDTSPSSAYNEGLPLGSKLALSINGVEFQPSEICPRNFIIFDHTDDRRQILFHPEIAHGLSYPSMNFNENPMGGNPVWKYRNNVERDICSAFSEDSDDIDTLLSLDGDDQDQEESDDDAISTARTQGYDGSSSPDSCSNYALKSRRVKCPSSSQESSSYGGLAHREGKRKKLSKMVKMLRGMVPGTDQMNTVSVLDEAVKYLKSMKVEVQKLGVDDL